MATVREIADYLEEQKEEGEELRVSMPDELICAASATIHRTPNGSLRFCREIFRPSACIRISTPWRAA